jgi:hypothetical protein
MNYFLIVLFFITVFAHSYAGIMGSNCGQGIDMSAFILCLCCHV